MDWRRRLQEASCRASENRGSREGVELYLSNKYNASGMSMEKDLG